MAGENIPFGPNPPAPPEEIERLSGQLDAIVDRLRLLPKGAELFNTEQERQRVATSLWRAKGWDEPLF